MTTKAKALYNYDATRDNEVAMKRGDNLIVLGNFGEWTYVSNLAISKKGMVPTNYIRVIPDNSTTPSEQHTTNTSSTSLSSSNTTNTTNNTNNANNTNQKLNVTLLQELVNSNDGNKYGIVIRTLTDNAGGKALAVKEGDIVKILEVYPTGWTNVLLVTTNESGLVSKQHYVEYKAGDPLPPQFTTEQQQQQPNQQQQNQIQSQQQQPQPQHQQLQQIKQIQQQNQRKSRIVSGVVKFSAVAKFDYNGRSESELTVKINDKIAVLKDDVPGGWWLASFNGKIGHVPPGYFEKSVPTVEENEEKKKKVEDVKPANLEASTVAAEPKKEDGNAATTKENNDVTANTVEVKKDEPVNEVKKDSENTGAAAAAVTPVATVSGTVAITPNTPANDNTIDSDKSPSNVTIENKMDDKKAENEENKKDMITEDKKEEDKEEEKGKNVSENDNVTSDTKEEDVVEEETRDPKGELPDCPFEATAIYDYNASGSEEVSLVSGEVVTVVSYALLGWVTVHKKAKDPNSPVIGHVPRDWIKAVDNSKYNKVDISENPDDYYKVLYTFNPNGPSQIPLKAGDVVQIISKEDP